MKFTLSLVSILIFSGCTHLSSVSTSNIPKKRNNKVSTSIEKFIFFAFNFSNSYVDEITLNLAKKCPKGKVQGVLTKHESITYFPLIAHKVRISADGYCVRSS